MAKLEGCVWRELPTQLINKFSNGGAALSIENGEKALICFDVFDKNKCEVHDGEYSMSTFSSRFTHHGGKLGYFRGKPTTVGGSYGRLSFGSCYERNKVESLHSFGWSGLPDFPER